MNVAANGEAFGRPQDQFSESVARIHQIEKRHARVNARRRQHREERAVRGVVGVAVTGPVVVAAADPWPKFRQDCRLKAALDGRRGGLVRENTP